jgi:hypothetical protein
MSEGLAQADQEQGRSPGRSLIRSFRPVDSDPSGYGFSMAADEAVQEAGGDIDKAEKIFEQRSHINDPEAVPSVPQSERPT